MTYRHQLIDKNRKRRMRRTEYRRALEQAFKEQKAEFAAQAATQPTVATESK